MQFVTSWSMKEINKQEGDTMDFEVQNIKYSYADVQALDNVSFGAMRGEIIGLVGANGAGKSTLIKNIYRFLTPDHGKILLDGKDIFSFSQWDYPVSYIPDTPVFYEELSLLEHLQFTKALYPRNDISVKEMIEVFDLHKHQNKIPSALSKGTRQKLMIAMALLRDYELLIADEPFSGLDPTQIAALKSLLIEQKKKQKIVILSSHLLDVVENICDKFVIIKSGKCLAHGSKQSLLKDVGLSDDGTMEDAYLRLVKQDDTSS